MQPPESESPSPDEPESIGEMESQDGIEELNARMERIEQKLDRLTRVLDEGEAVAATAVDVADSYARKAAEQGADVDQRVNALAPLLMRLTEPEVLDVLRMLVDRSDKLRQTVDMLDSLEGTAAMFVDVFDSYAMRLEQTGASADERVEALGSLAARLTEPEVVETIHALVDRSGKLHELIDMLDQMPGALAMAVDVFDDLAREAAEKGIDLVELSEGVSEAIVKIAAFVQRGEFHDLMESGILDPKAVNVVGKVAEAMSETSHEHADTTGAFGLFRAMRRTNIKRAVNFAVRLGDNFGALLDGEQIGSPRAQLPEGSRSSDRRAPTGE